MKSLPPIPDTRKISGSDVLARTLAAFKQQLLLQCETIISMMKNGYDLREYSGYDEAILAGDIFYEIQSNVYSTIVISRITDYADAPCSDIYGSYERRVLVEGDLHKKLVETISDLYD